jgi:hypothetical protein
MAALDFLSTDVRLFQKLSEHDARYAGDVSRIEANLHELDKSVAAQ